MATKAIYTNIDGNYYKVMQDTSHPSDLVHPYRTHGQMNTDASCKLVNSTIWINTIENDTVFSNRELYDKMVKYLEENKVTRIDPIQDRYVMYCDYSVFNHEGKQINHNAFTQPIKPKDGMYNLGVDKVSELVYKQVKLFETSISLNVKNDYPMGIMRNSSNVKYSIQINDIAVYQDLEHTESDIHNSSDPESYPIATVLSTMVKLYSTHDNGITISAVEVPFIPRKIMLDINIILDNLIVAYDEQDISSILLNNIDMSGGDSSQPPSSGTIIIFNGGSALE